MVLSMNRLKELTDDELITRYADGCNEAFDTLLERYDAMVHTYIRFTVSDWDLAEDIFQDTFIKVMTNIRRGKYKAQGKFKPWLMRIAHNLIMDVYRSREVQKTVGEPEHMDSMAGLLSTIPTDEMNQEERMQRHDLLTELYAKLDLLPMEQREVVHMRFWEDMSFREIAEATGVSINTALGRLRYALINLRRQPLQ